MNVRVLVQSCRYLCFVGVMEKKKKEKDFDEQKWCWQRGNTFERGWKSTSTPRDLTHRRYNVLSCARVVDYQARALRSLKNARKALNIRCGRKVKNAVFIQLVRFVVFGLSERTRTVSYCVSTANHKSSNRVHLFVR